MNHSTSRSWALSILRWASALPVTALVVACGPAEPGFNETGGTEDVGANATEATTEDGLATAYGVFKQAFLGAALDQHFTMSFGYHPGLSTEKLAPTGIQGQQPPRGQVFFNFVDRRISAALHVATVGTGFDLWFVKNVAGSGRTARPETGDQLLKIGSFGAPTPDGVCGSFTDCISIENLSVGSNVNFDLDMVVITRHDQPPTTSRIAVGGRTLFEKRFFREKAGRTLDAVTGTVATNIETTDPLIGRGVQLFFNETFGGNGRTCGTCHRAEDNLTIDPAFIATLPQSDPLFVAENNPALAQLEDRTLLRTRALVRENVDGFDDPTHKFVARSVNHTFSLSVTGSTLGGFGFFPFSAPDSPVGWSGDGAPGRGTMNDFAFGAIVQHFTKSLSRRPGVDFRIPTQEELDALEAFQLFTGRQKNVLLGNVRFREARATAGRDLFMTVGCTGCHSDFSQDPSFPEILSNGTFNTGVAGLTPELPADDGFLDGSFSIGFNVPPLIEAADTPPLFHNNAAANIEAAIAFYVSPTFRATSIGQFFFFNLDTTQQGQIGAFLRVVNAAENVRQVRTRAQFVRNTRSAGNTALLTVAIADTQDAIDVLSQKGLNAAAVNELQDIKTTLNIAKANPDANRPAFMDHALVFLNLVRGELFTANPDNQF